jgi:hypothetical protein
MPHRSTISVILLLALAACSKSDSKLDPFAKDEKGFAAYTHECIGEMTADGICKTKSKCTKDADSNCKLYIDGCIDGGHYYEGTIDGGTCTRKT